MAAGEESNLVFEFKARRVAPTDEGDESLAPRLFSKRCFEFTGCFFDGTLGFAQRFSRFS